MELAAQANKIAQALLLKQIKGVKYNYKIVNSKKNHQNKTSISYNNNNFNKNNNNNNFIETKLHIGKIIKQIWIGNKLANYWVAFK